MNQNNFNYNNNPSSFRGRGRGSFYNNSSRGFNDSNNYNNNYDDNNSYYNNNDYNDQNPQNESNFPSRGGGFFRGSGRGDQNGGFRGGHGRGGFAQKRGFGKPKPQPQEESEQKFSLGTTISVENLNKEIDATQYETINCTELLDKQHQDQKQQTKPNQVMLISNLVPFQAFPEAKYYTYDVKFNPFQENIKKASQVLNQTFGDKKFHFDGKSSIVAPEPLFKGAKMAFQHYEKAKSRFGAATMINIIVTLTSEIPSSVITPSLLQALNIGLEDSFAASKHAKSGRLFLHTETNSEGKKIFHGVIPFNQHGLDVAPGLLTSILNTHMGLVLNLDIGNRLIRRENLLTYINSKLQQGITQDAITKSLEGSTATVVPTGRKIHIQGIEWGLCPASEKEFISFGRKVLTYADFTLSKYSFQVKDMKQPLIFQYDYRNTLGDGNPDKEYFVPEILSLAGNFSEAALREISQKTGMGPEKRFKAIKYHAEKSFKDPKFQASGKTWHEDTVAAGENALQFIEVPSTVRDPAIIIDGTGKELEKEEASGKWTSSVPFRKPESFKKWALMSPVAAKSVEEQFIESFVKKSNKMGLEIPEPTRITVPNPGGEREYTKSILMALKQQEKSEQGQYDFVIVILKDEDSLSYSAVKQLIFVEMNNGPQCSCILLETIMKNIGKLEIISKSMIDSLIAKLGGAGWALGNNMLNFTKPTMIVGSDVYHSGEKGKKKKSSQLGFITTYDRTFTKIYSQSAAQEPGVEITPAPIIEKLMRNSLEKFRKENTLLKKPTYPHLIIWYRDGVGDAQELDVLKTEVEGARKALPVINENGDKPKLIVVVVLKRLHTKFLLQTDKGTTNPAPGTIVDTFATTPGKNQFYLVSQKDAFAVATPTKYTIIVNEVNFPLQHMEDLSFRLCHLYFNFSGSIKVPHVAQYAHMQARMRGQILGSDNIPSEKWNDTPSYL